MRKNNREIGTKYEYKVIDYLASIGYKIIFHSYSPTRSAEIDIISCDNDGTLVFTEVKAVQYTLWQPYDIAKKIDYRKIDKIKKLAHYFISNSLVPYSHVRFDVAFVQPNKITHYKGV